MQTDGLRKWARGLSILAAALLLAAPLTAQHLFTTVPHPSEGDDNPISFMRPHYLLQSAKASGQTVPPTTALGPGQVRHAYGFDQVGNQGHGQTIGLIDAYDDPTIEADLGVFDTQFSLPACTGSNGCFRKVYAGGKKPTANANWAVEIALDVEWAHAMAPQATIVLVEARSNSLSDLVAASKLAVSNGASVVSMSWTTGEFSNEKSTDNNFVASGVTFLAAAGDSGTGVSYPAASPDVVAVGGTSLSLDANGNYLAETAWSGSGGGLSTIEHEPSFQAQFGIPNDTQGRRGVPDVSYNANPGTGYAIYDSVAINGYAGWFQVGGTSAGTPQWAALVAIANSLRALARKAHLSSTDPSLYTLAQAAANADFNSVTQGSNGSCGAVCSAAAGYDYVTGLGTPQAPALVTALAARP